MAIWAGVREFDAGAIRLADRRRGPNQSLESLSTAMDMILAGVGRQR